MENSNENHKGSCSRGCLSLFGGVVGVIIALLLASIIGYFFLRGAAAYLIISDDLSPADVIIIMGGGDEGRMNEALKLYFEKYARIIVLTETGEQIGESNYLQSSDLLIQLMNNGVPSGNVLITDDEVTSTFEEARAVKRLLEKRQFSSAIIVTDPFHTKRTSIIFRDVFSGQDIRLYFHPVTPSWYNSRTWFLSSDGWKFTILEYIKLLAYKFGLQN
ncbi:MAG: YdcF family protein [Anaerolineaceae bacterium]|nr:YdcF family protein [Anaerolineaceae bacterium]